MKNAQGLTLLEILFALAIISILAIAAFTNILAFRNKNILNKAASAITTKLNYTRNNALTGNQQASWGTIIEPGQITTYCVTCPSGQEQTQTTSLDTNVTINNPVGTNPIIFKHLTGQTHSPDNDTPIDITNPIIITYAGWQIDIHIPNHGKVYYETIHRI